MRTNMRHKNGHNWGSRVSPRVRICHKPSYHIPRGSGMPIGTQIYPKSAVLSIFWGVIKVHNSINRGSVLILLKSDENHRS